MTEQEKRDRIEIAKVDGVEIPEERIAERLGKMHDLRHIYQGLVNAHTRGMDILGVVCYPEEGDDYKIKIGITKHGRTFVNSLVIKWEGIALSNGFAKREAVRAAKIVNEISDAIIEARDELKEARSTTRRRAR